MKVYRNPIRIGRNETVDGEKSSASVDPVVLLADGSQTSILTINVKNEFDKAIEGLASEDFVILGLQNAQAANFQNLGNGEYSFDITDQTAEGITLTIVVDGVEIADKPQIVFEQAANPTNSSATASPDYVAADGTETSTLSIVVRDYEDNPISGLVENDFVITDYGDAEVNNFHALNDGEYSFDISNTTAETIILTIEVMEIEISDQPQITFTLSDTIFAEDFSDLSSSFPTGWGSNSTGWSVYNSNQAGGTIPELRFYWSSGFDGVNRVHTGLIDASAASNLQLSFKHYVDHFVSSYTLSVQTQIEGSSTWETQWSDSINSNVGPQTLNIDFSSLDGEKFKIAWVFNGIDWNINNWYVDDIVLEQI